MLIIVAGYQYFTTQPFNYWSQMWTLPVTSTGLYSIPEQKVSGFFVLTDCYIINSWWFHICGYRYYSSFLNWFREIGPQVLIFQMMLFQTIKIWFQSPPRKSPDNLFSSSLYEQVMTVLTYFIILYEDCLFHIFGLNIDLCHLLHVIGLVIIDYAQELLAIFIQIDFQSSINAAEGESWLLKHTKSIPVMEMNKKEPYYFKYGKLITSHIVLSMSTKSKRNELDSNVSLDTDSYLFAIDTCTSENLCRHKELFIGDIKPCKNLFVQGVGGRVRASGYGSIKIRVTVDQNDVYDLIVHNVIYLPESPVNLLSPQKWSMGSDNLNHRRDYSWTGHIAILGSNKKN